jgi:hypothetical protein
VDTALQSGEKSLRMMERLVRAQLRRPEIQTTQGAAAEAATAESMGALR